MTASSFDACSLYKIPIERNKNLCSGMNHGRFMTTANVLASNHKTRTKLYQVSAVKHAQRLSQAADEHGRRNLVMTLAPKELHQFCLLREQRKQQQLVMPMTGLIGKIKTHHMNKNECAKNKRIRATVSHGCCSSQVVWRVEFDIHVNLGDEPCHERMDAAKVAVVLQQRFANGWEWPLHAVEKQAKQKIGLYELETHR
jgi:hypothetical protein